LSNGGEDPQRDVNRTFELTGTAGGRRVFRYYADTADHVLYLEDKFKKILDRRNIAAGVGGDGNDYNNNRKEDADEENTAGSGRKDSAENKNGTPWISKAAWVHIGNEVDFIDKRAAYTRRNREFEQAKNQKEKRNRMVLHYQTTDGSTVVLTGQDEHKKEVYIVLNRIDKKYTLPQSILVAGKYD